MTKPSGTDVTTVRLLSEQRWAYERKLEHLSYREMRSLANRPAPEGGLGYDLSESALKGLVAGYLERMQQVEADTVEFHLHRELADLDAQQRAHAVMVDPIDRPRLASIAASLNITPKRLVKNYPELIPWRDDKVVLAALAGLRAIGAERRKLLGLDAPATARLDVVHHDGVTLELNEMLERAGRPPIESSPPK